MSPGISIYRQHCTEKHIFFFQTPWKDGLSKIIALEHDLSCKTENERWSFLKNTSKYYIFFRRSEKMVFPKRTAPVHDFSCIIWKNGIFFPKTWTFFIGQKVKDSLSQEIHGNMKTWYIGSKLGVSLNLFGWRYSTMNNLQYFVPFNPQGLCLGVRLGTNKGNYLSIRG